MNSLCVFEAVTGSRTALTTWWPSGETKGLTWGSDACLLAHESRWLWSELCGVNAEHGTWAIQHQSSMRQPVCPCQSGASQLLRPDVGLKLSFTAQFPNHLNHRKATGSCTVKESSQLFLETDSSAKCINVNANECWLFMLTCGHIRQCDKVEKHLSLCWKCELD